MSHCKRDGAGIILKPESVIRPLIDILPSYKWLWDKHFITNNT